jgi:hypothetical protein
MPESSCEVEASAPVVVAVFALVAWAAGMARNIVAAAVIIKFLYFITHSSRFGFIAAPNRRGGKMFRRRGQMRNLGIHS